MANKEILIPFLFVLLETGGRCAEHKTAKVCSSSKTAAKESTLTVPRSKKWSLWITIVYIKAAARLNLNIGTQSVQEFCCDRNIRRTVYSNDLDFVFVAL